MPNVSIIANTEETDASYFSDFGDLSRISTCTHTWNRQIREILIIHKNTDKATESILDGLLTAYSLQNKHNNSDIESLMTLIWNQKKEVQILPFHPNMIRF